MMTESQRLARNGLIALAVFLAGVLVVVWWIMVVEVVP